ncbi:zf-HC2 domain-containing protein [Longispora sp. K20-0274]|uniref:zf-HC2 domain-containing protein n=1 Tax=Longispora sp. K20-0274 TaxID=3088255 RepID=UPI00399B7DE6
MTHDRSLVGAYVLGALDDAERRAFDEHLTGCAECRREVAELEEVTDVLGEVPPEALLYGPPDDDAVLDRTLDRLRAEQGTRDRSRRLYALAAGIVVLAGVAVGGVMVGRASVDAPPPVALPSATATATATPQPPGTLRGTTVDAASNVRLTASVVPVANWVKVTAAVAGIPQGENCRLVIVGRDGSREVAGGWIVSEKGAATGTTLDGTAALDVRQVARVEIVNTSGRTFASLPL